MSIDRTSAKGFQLFRSADARSRLTRRNKLILMTVAPESNIVKIYQSFRGVSSIEQEYMRISQGR